MSVDVEEESPREVLDRLTVTGWVCEEHGLAWETRDGALEHERDDRCSLWRARTLDELQRQMDRAVAELENADRDVSFARSRIAEASSLHRRARLAHDDAKERADLARRLWAEQAQAAAKQILAGDR